MGQITAELTMSLDGYVAHLDDSVEYLFDWYFQGPVTVSTAMPRLVFRTSATSADHIRAQFARIGALLTGRRLFDYTKGWGGRHPIDVPVLVLTHGPIPREWMAAYPGAPFEFVTDGLEAALRRAADLAGSKDVAVAGPNVIQQCLDSDRLDELCVDLVPVLLGQGIPFFGRLRKPPVRLEITRVVPSVGVTHLFYAVRKEAESLC